MADETDDIGSNNETENLIKNTPLEGCQITESMYHRAHPSRLRKLLDKLKQLLIPFHNILLTDVI